MRHWNDGSKLMFRSFVKWTSLSIVAVAASLVVLLAIVLFGIDNTVESDSFNEERFAAIGINTPRAEVLDVLGSPLAEDCQTRVGETWQYGTTDVVWGPSAHSNKLIEFDSNGR